MSWPLPEDEDERMSTLRSLELSAARVPQSAPPQPRDATRRAGSTRRGTRNSSASRRSAQRR